MLFSLILFPVLTWRMVLPRTVTMRAGSKAGPPDSSFRTCPNGGSRSSTSPTRTSRCRRNPCPGTRPLPAKPGTYSCTCASSCRLFQNSFKVHSKSQSLELIRTMKVEEHYHTAFQLDNFKD